MKLSIVIPTYNRFGNLINCLKRLQAQTLDKSNFEVIIINDGSDELGYKKLELKESGINLDYTYIKQANSGPAKARNAGIRASRNEVIVFIGDDMLLKSTCLEKHYIFHQADGRENSALLGKVVWPDKGKFRNDKFLSWLDSTPFQFDFKSLKTGAKTDFLHFYTSNISVKKLFLLKNGLFNEEFPAASGEDTELGYRLEKAGLQLIYDETAVAEHYHFIKLENYIGRMKQAGRSSRMIVELHPELRETFEIRNNLLNYFKNIIKNILGFLGNIFKIPRLAGWSWSYKLKKSYRDGYRK